jgi:hypothetical protein
MSESPLALAVFTSEEIATVTHRNKRRSRVVSMLLRTYEVPGSNLAPEKGDYDFFVWLFSVPPGK